MSDKTETSKVIPAAEMVEGPFFGGQAKLRSDIADGRPGVPFKLAIDLIDIDSNAPLEGLRLDIWHCDATGHYSGINTEDFDPDTVPKDVSTVPLKNEERFLRGAQLSDQNGRVVFNTIFPGWYACRTTHIHLKVFNGDVCVLTSQLYIAEDICREVYGLPQYRRNVEQDTFNSTDTVIALTADSIAGCWVDIERSDDGYIGSAKLGVDLTAESHPVDAPKEFKPPYGGIPHDHEVR